MYYNDVYHTLCICCYVFITDGAGFVWDPSADAWEERFQELRTYTHTYIYIYHWLAIMHTWLHSCYKWYISSCKHKSLNHSLIVYHYVWLTSPDILSSVYQFSCDSFIGLSVCPEPVLATTIAVFGANRYLGAAPWPRKGSFKISSLKYRV